MNTQIQLPGTNQYQRIANRIYATKKVAEQMRDKVLKRLIDEVIDLQSYGPLANSPHQVITYQQYPDQPGQFRIENGHGREIINRQVLPNGKTRRIINLLFCSDVDYEGNGVFMLPQEY